MYALDLELAIFDGPPNLPPSALEIAIFREALEALVRINRLHLRADPTIPRLYELARRGELHYQEPGETDDPWCDIPRARRRRAIDCEDAACWRVAELIERENVPARVGFSIGPHPDGQRRLIHIFVRLPNGQTEDPSRVLGMR